MAQPYPTFQSVMSSTPFSGTMADTSTPTPAGQMPQTPQPTEAPGAFGERERAKKIQENIDFIDQKIKTIENLKWTPTNRWGKAIHTALNGKAIEPADMMYKRYGLMTDLMQQRQALMEEQRLLMTPSPQKQMDVSEAEDRKRRTDYVAATNAALKNIGAAPLPPEIEYQFIEKGNSLNEALAKRLGGGDDEVKQMTAEATLGEKLGPEGVSATGLKGRSLAVVTAGAKHGEVVRKEKDSTEEKGKYAGFDSLTGLTTAVNSTYDNIAESLKTEQEVEGYYQDPVTGIRKKGKIIQRVITPEGAKEARRRAINSFEGAAKWLPGYVDSDRPPTPVVDPNQQGVDVNKIRKDLVGPR